MKKIILFELNEVPTKIIDYYAVCRPNSVLARLRRRSRQYETFAEDSGHLTPWTTWSSVHRGVSSDRHFIGDFGQDLTEVNKAYPQIWDILAKNGIKTGVFGSLHSYPPPSDYQGYGFYIPDVFASGSECFPKTIEAFQQFNLRLSRASFRNASPQLPWQSALDVLKNWPDLGFKPRTLADISQQIVSERWAAWKVTRRRTYQAVLAFDVFYHQLTRFRPSFTTFFTNHVAATMHRYWAATFPEDYEEQTFERAWQERYGHEILFALDKTDRMLGHLEAFLAKNKDYSLWLASSMGQEAFASKPIETQVFLTNFDKWRQFWDIEAAEIRPAMFPQFNFRVSTEVAARLTAAFQNTVICSKPLRFRQHDQTVFSLELGHRNIETADLKAWVQGRAVDCADMGLTNIVIQDKSATTAYHIPQGILWVYQSDGRPTTPAPTTVSTLDIAPSILTNFGIKTPQYMGQKPLFRAF